MDVKVAVGTELFLSPPAPPPQPDMPNTLKAKVHNIAGKNDFFMFYLLKIALADLQQMGMADTAESVGLNSNKSNWR